jgi:ribose 5-phosphate isomerase B
MILDMVKKIALAADHAGFEEKEKIKKTLDEIGIEYDDMGTNSSEPVDYPDFARKVADAVSSGEYEQGLLVCGSGTGMAIAANKVKGVRAAVAWNEDIARLAREHNDANVLSLPARFVPEEESAKIVKAFFTAGFDGGRHERRVEKITEIEKNERE